MEEQRDGRGTRETKKQFSELSGVSQGRESQEVSGARSNCIHNKGHSGFGFRNKSNRWPLFRIILLKISHILVMLRFSTSILLKTIPMTRWFDWRLILQAVVVSAAPGAPRDLPWSRLAARGMSPPYGACLRHVFHGLNFCKRADIEPYGFGSISGGGSYLAEHQAPPIYLSAAASSVNRRRSLI
jgi:hypothetical protein